MKTIKDQQQKMAEMQTILDQHEAKLANLAHSVPQRTPPATPSGQERDKTVLLGANVSNYYLHIPKTGGVGAFSQLRSDNGGRKVCNHAGKMCPIGNPGATGGFTHQNPDQLPLLRSNLLSYASHETMCFHSISIALKPVATATALTSCRHWTYGWNGGLIG